MTVGWLLLGQATPRPSPGEPSLLTLPPLLLVGLVVVFTGTVFVLLRMALRARGRSDRGGAPAVRDHREAELVRRYAEGDLDEHQFRRRLLELHWRLSPDRPTQLSGDDPDGDG